MEDKLFNATMEFYRACDVKLEKKEKEGWVGWDDEKYKPRFIRKVFSYDAQPTQEDLVDIANYCDFLWNLIQVKKGGETK